MLRVIFFYYQFKRKQININYTFIQKSKKEYYLHILKLIAVLSLTIFTVYIICGFISCLIYKEVGVIVTFLIAALISSVDLSIVYLFLSYLEKSDYDNEKSSLKRSFLIPGVMVSLTFLILGISNAIYYNIINNGLVSTPGAFITYVNLINKNMMLLLYGLFGIALSYLLAQSDKMIIISRSIKCLFIFIFIIVLKDIVGIIPMQLIDGDVIAIVTYGKIISYIDCGINIIVIFLISYLLFGVVKERGINKNIMFFSLFEIIVFCISLFLSTQASLQVLNVVLTYLTHAITSSLLFLILYLYDNKQKQVSN